MPTGQWDDDGGLTVKKLNTSTLGLGGVDVTAALSAAATSATARVRAEPVSLLSLAPVATMKDALPDAPNATTLGLADIAGSAVLGTTTNSGGTNAASETVAFEYTLPGDYVAGAAVTLRIRAKVSVTRTTAQTVDAVVKVVADGALGADICATSVQTITTAYANYDFTITPTALVAGGILNVVVTLATTAGVASDGLPSISKIEMRPTVLT